MITLDPKHVPVRPGDLGCYANIHKAGFLFRPVAARARMSDGAMMWLDGHWWRDASRPPIEAFGNPYSETECRAWADACGVRWLDVAPARLPSTMWLYDGGDAFVDRRLFNGERVRRVDPNAPRIGWHESGALLLTRRVPHQEHCVWRTIRVISHDVEEILASVPEEHFVGALEALTGQRCGGAFPGPLDAVRLQAAMGGAP